MKNNEWHLETRVFDWIYKGWAVVLSQCEFLLQSKGVGNKGTDTKEKAWIKSRNACESRL